MSWLDTLKGRAQEAKAKPAATRPAPKPRAARREIKAAWFQTAAPCDGDCGAVETLHYFVADGVVTLCDERGKPMGKSMALAEGDEPGTIAARLGRAAWIASGAGSDFNRRLDYGPIGIA